MTMTGLVWRALLVASVISPALGCSAAMMAGLGAGLTAASGGGTSYSLGLPVGKIMIFGGNSHSVYLGCLSCSKFDSESVFNQYGTYGSSYSGQSIFNKFSEYGSDYSAHSACNASAIDPPIIVDDRGQSYGRLVIGSYRTDSPNWPALRAWLAGVCQ